MKQKFDLNNWERKVHFEFFNQFDDPNFEITAHVECSEALNKCKQNNYSFFLYYLHASLKAANSIMEFRLRLEDDQLYIYDKINAGPTIARENGTFGFSVLPYFEDFDRFRESSKKIIQEVKVARDLNPSFNHANVIHYSSMPWISFTSIAHPKFSYKVKDSVPKISFGKVTKQDVGKHMPVSVTANHALMDGLHISKFFELFQKHLNR